MAKVEVVGAETSVVVGENSVVARFRTLVQSYVLVPGVAVTVEKHCSL